ncbi:MAG: response regulator [Verrucomicrobiae bacterium]|nr:response regulator [Verrucomicrobiae bacterium]
MMKRILIVDDDERLTRLMHLNLKETGRFVVREENRANAAVRTALAFAPDLVVLDVMMPEMDGGDVAAQIRSRPELNHVPIVFLTAAAKKNEVDGNHGRIGGIPFLAKPVDIDELTACLDRTLASAKLTI